MGRDVLLVEGQDDQYFFQTYSEKVLSNNALEVYPPKAAAPTTGNGWGNLIKNLPILLGELKNGNIDKLGIILDADYPPDNSGGFSERYNKVIEKLKTAGYIIPTAANAGKGDIFQHSNGLEPIGLWIMPNHQDNGMLENFIESMITSIQQKSLLNHAQKSIDDLPVTLFDKQLHTAKAKIFTWRAWQTEPGLSPNKALNDSLLDLDQTTAANFTRWLQTVFA